MLSCTSLFEDFIVNDFRGRDRCEFKSSGVKGKTLSTPGYSFTVRDEIGTSDGPGGTTTHYSNPRTVSSPGHDFFVPSEQEFTCFYCQRKIDKPIPMFGSVAIPKMKSPKIKIFQSGKNKVLTYDCSLPPCGSLEFSNQIVQKLYVDAKKIDQLKIVYCWDNRRSLGWILSRMWELAIKKDKEEGFPIGFTYEVKKSSTKGCCVLL